MNADQEDEEDESIIDRIQAECDAEPTSDGKLAVLLKYMGPSLAHQILGVLEGGHIGDVVDLSETGGEDPRLS